MSASKRKQKATSGASKSGGNAGKGSPRTGGRVALVVLLVAAAAAVWASLALIRSDSSGVPAGLHAGSAKGFDVLLVTLDTTRADHIGCYGYAGARTPTLDRLAAEGIWFDDAISPVPLTLPAHASILTGLNPTSHGVRSNGAYRLDDSFTTLSERFQDAGYDTAGFVSAFVLDGRFGLAQGMALFDAKVETPGVAFGGLDSRRPASEVTDAALAWMKRRDNDRPYFLWVHYYDPHDPYVPPEPYATQFAGRPYDGEIAYMDAQLGRIMEAIRQSPRSDRTLVVVVGDHGESLNEHDEFSHGRTLYEATQRVPLIVWSGGATGGAVVDKFSVGLVDIFPTVVELAGLEPVESLDGRSLLSIEGDPERMIYMETLETYLENGWAPLYALRRHDDKYIHAPKPEYYDLRADPHELNNLFPQLTPAQQEEVGKLAQALAEQVRNSPSAQEVAETALELDPESIDRLRSLGYFGRDPGERPAMDGELPNPRDMLPTYRLVQEAERLADEGRMDEALSKARRAVELSPNDRQALYRLGLICAWTQRFDEAEESFRKCNAIREDSNVYTLLGQIAMLKGRLAEAEELIKKAIEVDPKHGGGYIAMGDLRAMTGKADEARAYYNQALEVDPYRAHNVVADRLEKLEQVSRRSPNGAAGGTR
ncbi:MAG: sulfatase-like hydrolase/transferase [Phycisphaerae bacterium]|nr:sulfatase-like hydrolase/transferase [Phycisphaerae bacterium]